MSSIAMDILLIVTAGLLGGIVAQLFRQPLLLGYLVAGIAIGPYTPIITVSNVEQVKMLADVGAALLLFSLGLEFPLKSLRPIRGIAFGGTLLQVALTLLLCTGLGLATGFGTSESWWFGTAFISSSTAVILKTLSNQGYAGSLSGRLMLGMSIVQDLTVIPIMILLCHLAGGGTGELDWLSVAKPLLYTAIFVAIMVVVGSRLTPKLLYYVAQLHSRELFLLIVMVLGLGIGFLTGCFGLSYAFGAFVAGMVLSESDYSHRAVSELGSLRDIFVLIFFVSVGMLCNPVEIFKEWQLVIGVFLAATFGRGLLLSGITWLFGYRRVIPAAVLFGMLPVSEIAFVLIQQGASIGAIGDRLYNLILNVTVLSMLAGPLFANLTRPVYRLFRRVCPEKSGRTPWERSIPEDKLRQHFILVGSDLLPLGELLAQSGGKVVYVEAEHARFLQLKSLGWPAVYGDPSQAQLMEAAGVAHAKMLVVAAETETEAYVLIDAARQSNPSLPVLLQWTDPQETPERVRSLPAVTVVETESAAALESLRTVLISLGWSLPEIYNCLLRLSTRRIDRTAATQDRYGFPLFMQFFGTAALEIEPHGRWDGCALRDSRLREDFDLSVLGVSRNEQFLAFPNADFEFAAGDRVLLLGRADACEKWMNQSHEGEDA